jgi:hypothetical protein
MLVRIAPLDMIDLKVAAKLGISIQDLSTRKWCTTWRAGCCRSFCMASKGRFAGGRAGDRIGSVF